MFADQKVEVCLLHGPVQVAFPFGRLCPLCEAGLALDLLSGELVPPGVVCPNCLRGWWNGGQGHGLDCRKAVAQRARARLQASAKP